MNSLQRLHEVRLRGLPASVVPRRTRAHQGLWWSEWRNRMGPNSGHFVYLDHTKRFARDVAGFVAAARR
jgi:hypothetical protein